MTIRMMTISMERPWPVFFSHQSPRAPPMMFPATPTVAYIRATFMKSGPVSRPSSSFHQMVSNWAAPTARCTPMPPRMVRTRAGERLRAAMSSGRRLSMPLTALTAPCPPCGDGGRVSRKVASQTARKRPRKPISRKQLRQPISGPRTAATKKASPEPRGTPA